MERGILYVATDDDVFAEARTSLETVRETMGEISVAVVTDRDRDSDVFDSVITLDDPEYGFGDKIVGMQRSPFDSTLYFDTDIYVHSPVFELFDLLETFDIAARHNHNRDLYTECSLGVPDSFPEYNSGVVAFDAAATEGLFDRWADRYDPDHPGDQPSFRSALFDSGVRIATLPAEYNYAPRYPGHVAKDIKIFHGRLLDIDTRGAGKGIDIEDVVDDINAGDGHRLYTSGGCRLWPDQELTSRIERSLRRRGVRGTVGAALVKARQRLLR